MSKYLSSDKKTILLAEAWLNGEHNYEYVMEEIKSERPILAAVLAIGVHRELIHLAPVAHCEKFHEYLKSQ